MCRAAHYGVKYTRAAFVDAGEVATMTLTSLQALTWGTVAAAVLSALLLAAGESGLPDLSRWQQGDSAARPSLTGDMTAPALQRKDAGHRKPVAGAASNRRDRGGR
jgi:hypothetical protein